MLSGIPEATNRKSISLIAATSDDIAIVVTQGAAPGIVCVGLRRTPPDTEVANEAEYTIEATVTARKTLKAAFVGAVAGIIPALF